MDGLETVAGAAMEHFKDDAPLSLEEAAHLTRTTPQTVFYWIRKGKLKGHKDPSSGNGS